MKRLMLIVIAIMFLGGCATLNEHAERTWHEDMEKWAIEQTKKCPIKESDCLTLTSIEYNATTLTYNHRVLNTDKCKPLVEDFRILSNADMARVVRQRLGNRVALQYVSIKHYFYNERGELINDFYIRKTD